MVIGVHGRPLIWLRAGGSEGWCYPVACDQAGTCLESVSTRSPVCIASDELINAYMLAVSDTLTHVQPAAEQNPPCTAAQ